MMRYWFGIGNGLQYKPGCYTKMMPSMTAYESDSHSSQSMLKLQSEARRFATCECASESEGDGKESHSFGVKHLRISTVILVFSALIDVYVNAG